MQRDFDMIDLSNESDDDVEMSMQLLQERATKRVRIEHDDVNDSIFAPGRHCSQPIPGNLYEPLVPIYAPLVVKSADPKPQITVASVSLPIEEAFTVASADASPKKIDEENESAMECSPKLAVKRTYRQMRRPHVEHEQQVAQLTQQMGDIKLRKRCAKKDRKEQAANPPITERRAHAIACPLCGKHLNKSSALGGHMSKAHPN